MKKLIRVLSYKQVKTDKIYDVIKCVDVVWAEVNESEQRAFILSGEYNSKCIESFDESYQNFDFTYDELNIDMIKDGKTFKTDTELKEFAEGLYKDRYFIVEDTKLEATTDKNIIEAFKQFQSPSVSKELGALIERMKANEENGFQIPVDLTSKLLGKTDSLKEQDENQFKSITEYDILGKYKELRSIVIGQDDELKILLANILKNISLSYSELDDQKIKNLKSRILLIGGTGTGKTLMVENIARLLNVPYTIEDAKRYTSNGYIGEDVENMLINLYRAAGENKEKFTHGVIFIDEVDKLCNVKDDKSHVATTDVQEALLKLLDGTKVVKTIRKGFKEETIELDTTKVTFVLSGAFNELSNNDDYENDSVLIQRGMIPELVARLNTKVTTNKPTLEDLRKALTDGKYSYIKLLEEYFNIYGIDLEVTEEFIDEIVIRAHALDQGYRALNKVINDIVNEHLFNIFSGDIKKLTLDKQ